MSSAMPAGGPPATAGAPTIQVESVTVGYGSTVILADVSFEVARGEVFGILGGSGCGKSTLLKSMIGLLEPLAGRVLIDNVDIARAQGEARRTLLQRFGVMYQQGALFGSMTLLDNVRLPLEEYTQLPPDAIELVARMKLDLVGLAPAAELMPAELSGGMRKRGAIARAMALDPSILFLDEPSAGLDPVTSADLDQLIVRLARTLGITFVIVTHELASVFTVADRVVMLEREAKGIIASGNPHTLRDSSHNPKVRSFFRRLASDAPNHTVL